MKVQAAWRYLEGIDGIEFPITKGPLVRLPMKDEVLACNSTAPNEGFFTRDLRLHSHS